jgi:signal transduction histidine kinase/FixJ family two-component response regulator
MARFRPTESTSTIPSAAGGADSIAGSAAEHELARKTDELDALLRALPDIYFRLDDGGRIVAWHAGREAELHVPPEQFIGRRPDEVVPPHVAPTIAAIVERARRERVLVTAEYALPTPSGDDQFEARLVPCGDDQVTAIIRNTTARRRAEAALRASEERLRASQKLEAIGRLAGGVAHDFNNLLTVVLGRLQFLKHAVGLDEANREHLREAFDATERAVKLARQLLGFSRGQILQPRVFWLNEVVTSMHDVLRRVAGEHIEVLLALDEHGGAIDSDPVQVEQAILNLVLNARDAMPDGGTLILSTHQIEIDEREAAQRDGARPGTYVVLAVSDTGCGMDGEVMAHLFEPFFTTKPQGAGTGLGLATVYGIVKQSGGHAVVRTEVGVGSTFELCFPRSLEPAVRTFAANRVSSSPEALVGSAETILVVEDEEGLRRLVVEILHRADYRVLSAARGEEAIRVLLKQRQPVALLLTDVVMPGMNGRTLAARVLQLRPDVRVLLMSGHDDADLDRRRASGEATAAGLFGRPADRSFSIVQKPFTEQALLARIRDILGAGETSASSAPPGAHDPTGANVELAGRPGGS